MEHKVEIMGRQVIKPASPSPHDRLQLSLMDFNMPSVYVSLIFFYNLSDQAEKSINVISRKLKSSLSQTLSRFYPLAGKKEGVFIICNDQGVVFTEATTDVHLSGFLENLDIDSLKVFLPALALGESPESWPLLNLQVTFFGSSSGFAVGVSVSHNICDITSVSTFVKGWAASAKWDSSNELSTPQFAEAAIYPPADISVPPPVFNGFKRKCVVNRFFFESDKIKELKSVAASKIVPSPTRVEAISSLIWRCAKNASHANLVVPRPSIMAQSLDLRPRIPTVLSPDTIGNLSTIFFLKRDPGSKIEISETVAEFRKEKEKFSEMMMSENLDDYTLGLKIMSGVENYMSERKPNIDEFCITSWCRKGFYEVNFGWGRPVWVGLPFRVEGDMMFTVLMDAKDGEGVEVWVGLDETDMTAFVCDQDLLTYATLNPPVLI